MNTYGKCPQCGTDSISRERRPNGNDKCANGHTYPSANAIQSHSGGEALSQPNEPVAEVGFNNDVVWIVEDADNCNIPKCGTKLFLAPPNLEAKIAELTNQNQSLVDDVEILTAKCEKMREALQQEYNSYSDKSFVPKYIIDALEECK